MSDTNPRRSTGDGAKTRATRSRGRSKTVAPAQIRRDSAAGGELDRGVYEGLAGFRYAMRRFLAFSEVIAGAAGITSQQYQAMLVIKTHPGGAVSIKELAEQMLLLPNGAVQMVDRLAAAGFVERTPSPVDRRSVLVGLTKEGSRLLEQLAADHSRELLNREPLLAESLRRLRRMKRHNETQ